MKTLYVPIFLCPTCGFKPTCEDAAKCPWRIYLDDDELKRLTKEAA